MEVLFDNNVFFVFFFAMITIFNYSILKEYQRIVIIYITVYALSFTHAVSVNMAMCLICSSLFCYLEILTKDEMKFKLLTNPFYKCLDCVYLSFFQYAFLEMVIAIVLTNSCFEKIFYKSGYVYKFLSLLMMVVTITLVLQQRYVINSFKDMYRVFAEFPINKVDFNDKLSEACKILVSIEDKIYYERKGYTFVSLNAISCILNNKFGNGNLLLKINCIFKAGKRFINNTISGNRGYSTIPMQLIRSLGIARGYNYVYRRKVFEFLYSRMFFDGIKKMFREDKVAQKEHFEDYLLYIYFHKVNTFLGDAKFSKFLNAFDMQYSRKNKKDIYDCSNEGIFIACMGLSKRAMEINKKNVWEYIDDIEVELNGDMICDMVKNMMKKPYDGNYLK